MPRVRKNSFSTLHIFDLGLNCTRIAGFVGGCSPSELAGPGCLTDLFKDKNLNMATINLDHAQYFFKMFLIVVSNP